MNVNKALVKEFEGKTLKEIVDSPVYAIAGISESDAKLLEAAFRVKTVKDLANLKYVKWAQAIVSFGGY